MALSTPTRSPRLRFHPQAYLFVTEALRVTQELLGRETPGTPEEDGAHISGRELLDGVRVLGLKQFGMMSTMVFHAWGVMTTEDFGRIVFEMVDRGELRKTDRDSLADFLDIYNFDEVFQREYRVDTSKAFSS
ncbi:MAG: hypothetical protein SH850_17590 [Planctomycetaceae bacterium]|nr:hypothetical protein [Planctomycetaceae bacterium]